MEQERIERIYIPMTETAFYILLSLREPMHGYGIMQKVEEQTKGRVNLGPGTLYGSLSKMDKDGLIYFLHEENKRKVYKISPLGNEMLKRECLRVSEQYKNILQSGIGVVLNEK